MKSCFAFLVFTSREMCRFNQSLLTSARSVKKEKTKKFSPEKRERPNAKHSKKLTSVSCPAEEEASVSSSFLNFISLSISIYISISISISI